MSRKRDLTFRCNSKRNRREPPRGSIIKRKGRYAYKLKTPDPADPDWHKLVVPGQRYATKIKDFAVSLAWKVYNRYYGEEAAPDMPGLLEQFQAAQALRVGPDHLRKQMVCVRDFVEQQEIAQPEDITTASVGAYLAHLGRRGLAPNSVKNARGHIGRFCTWLQTIGELLVNPARQVEAPTVPERAIIYLDDEEWDAALSKAEEIKLYPVLWAMLAGLRVSEMKRLRRTDIQDAAAGKILVVEGKDPMRGRRVESIPLHPRLVELLKEMPTDGEYLFPRYTKWWWETALKPLKKVCPTLAKPGQGWHTLRRSFATRLLRRGARLETVSRLLRHCEVRVTERHYAHLTAEAGRGDLERL